MKIVLFFFALICMNTYGIHAQNAILPKPLERVVIVASSPDRIWYEYSKFISLTQKELLIVTPSIEGKKGIQPLEEIMGKIPYPKIHIIFSGIPTRKDEGYKAAEILGISSYFHPAKNNKLNTFITSTFIIQDRKNVFMLSGMSLQEYKIHPKASPLLLIIENDPEITQKFIAQFTAHLNNDAEEIKTKSFQEKSLSLTRKELWNSH
jgi:hypothetical protein